jgi:alanine racemase
VDVHLKVDTGMHRVGAAPAEVVGLAKLVADHPSLRLESVWTHCAVADEPEDPFTALQLERYEITLAEVAAAGIEVPLRHAANSAAAIAHPASRYDLVRCGISVYGIPPAPALAGAVALRPAVRLATEVAFVKALGAGEGISYGLRHHLERDTVVATLPIGYADGVFRNLGVRGQDVLVGGRRCPMVGVVTMDQVMVDVGPDSDVRAGDEAVLLGAQGDDRITPDEWAAQLDTISYEVVCALGARVERRYTDA